MERPPHYDTFADFHYSYHYGDSYIPYIKQEEPLKAECQHFLDCIESGAEPLTSGHQGLELVRILEAASKSLKGQGAPVVFTNERAGHSSWKSGPATGIRGYSPGRGIGECLSSLIISRNPVAGWNNS